MQEGSHPIPRLFLAFFLSLILSCGGLVRAAEPPEATTTSFVVFELAFDGDHFATVVGQTGEVILFEGKDCSAEILPTLATGSGPIDVEVREPTGLPKDPQTTDTRGEALRNLFQAYEGDELVVPLAGHLLRITFRTLVDDPWATLEFDADRCSEVFLPAAAAEGCCVTSERGIMVCGCGVRMDNASCCGCVSERRVD